MSSLARRCALLQGLSPAMSAAQLAAELAAMDERRAALSEQILAAEQERTALRAVADAIVRQKRPLIAERDGLVPPEKKEKRSLTSRPAAAAKEARGGPREERSVDGGRAQAAVDASAGEVVDGSILVPTIEQALRANGDSSLFSATFMNTSFRESKLVEHRQSFEHTGRPVEPTSGGARYAYLVSVNPRRSSGYDGFVLWREEWGRRDAYDVMLLGLSYAEEDASPGDTSLARRLLDAMFSRLDHSRLQTVRTEVSEKATMTVSAYWRSLGFIGIRGSSILTRTFGEAAVDLSSKRMPM